MKTVQMTLNEELIKAVDRAAKQMGTTRSGFTRRALERALRELSVKQLEAKQRRGYKLKPIQPGEFSDWEDEQVWIES